MKNELKQRPQSRTVKKSATQSRIINKDNAQEYFNKGKEEQLANNIDNAIDLYVKAIIYKHDYFQAYCNLGFCYKAQGKYVQAKNYYLKSISINEEDAISHYNLANLYRIMSDYQQSIKHYDIVIKLRQQQSDTLYLNSLVNVGICYKNLGFFEQAIKTYQKVNEISPDEKCGIFNLAMCLICALQQQHSYQFKQVSKLRSQKCQILLAKCLQFNPTNQMVLLSQIKLKYLVDPKAQDYSNSIVSLKQLLTVPNCVIRDQINQQIGFCLNRLQHYQEGVKYYQHSNNINSYRSSRTSSVYESISNKNIFQSFSPNDNAAVIDSKYISQSEGIQLIESGDYSFVQEHLQKFKDDSLLKHTLKLILYLKLAEEDEKYRQTAIEYYSKFFNQLQNGDSYSKLSYQGHRAVGKVLSFLNKYQESIKHYEYLSMQLKNSKSVPNAKQHSCLGDNFQQVGDLSKALEQYIIAFELDPNDLQLSFNIGCCLYDSGRYEQALNYFNKFVVMIQNDTETDEATKQLYMTDCYMTIALCSQGSLDILQKYKRALQMLIQLKNKSQQLQLDEGNLLTFFLSLADHYQIKIKQLTSKNQEYFNLIKILLQCYELLLQLSNCPDRNQVLTNCGNFYYECRQYLSSIEAYSQISDPSKVPHNNIGLAYLHLIEPILALKSMGLAQSYGQSDLITEVNKQIMEWIYCRQYTGRWNSKLPNIKEDCFYQRNQYGIGLIEKLTIQLNSRDIATQNELKSIIQDLFEKDYVQFDIKQHNIKYQKIKLLVKSNVKVNYHANSFTDQILKAAFCRSEDVRADFKQLITLLLGLQLNGNEAIVIQSAIFLFIFHNQFNSNVIIQMMKQFTNIKKKNINLSLQKIIQQNTDVYSIQPNFQSTKQLILLLREWQCILQKKTSVIIQKLESYYYQCQIYRPFQIQYHFPRHYNLRECDQTFAKLMFIILKIIKYNKRIFCKGTTIVEMKDNLIKQFQSEFNSQINFFKESQLKEITLSDEFVPVTLYAYFKNKQECLKFVAAVAQLSSIQRNIEISDCEQFTIILNKVVRVRCKWSDPFLIKSLVAQIMMNIIEDPLYIVNQSIIALQKIRENVRDASQYGAKLVQEEVALQF